MIGWLFATLKQYPEIAIFLALGIGYYVGSFTFKGIGLGAVTATLIAAVIIGQIGITVTGPLKPFAFLMFLFAIGYGVGPQFVRGIAQDGVPQAIFSAVQCVFCLAVPVDHRENRRLRPRRCRGLVCGFADNLGFDGPRNGCHWTRRSAGGREQGHARYDASCVRGNLHLRNSRFGDCHRADRVRLSLASTLSKPASVMKKNTAAARSRRAEPGRPGISSTSVPIA